MAHGVFCQDCTGAVFPAKAIVDCISNNSACQAREACVQTAWGGSSSIPVCVFVCVFLPPAPNSPPARCSPWLGTVSALKICKRARVWLTSAGACERALLHCPRSSLTLTTLPATPCARSDHPSVVNYQGSIALMHTDRTLMRITVRLCVCVRVRLGCWWGMVATYRRYSLFSHPKMTVSTGSILK